MSFVKIGTIVDAVPDGTLFLGIKTFAAISKSFQAELKKTKTKDHFPNFEFTYLYG